MGGMLTLVLNLKTLLMLTQRWVPQSVYQKWEMKLACKRCINYKPCSMLRVPTLLTELLFKNQRAKFYKRFPPYQKTFHFQRIFDGLILKPRRWFLDSCFYLT